MLPLLITIFPVLGFDAVSHDTFHQLILVVVIPTTALALGMGYRRHRSALAAILGLAGIAALIAAAFVVHALGSEALERWVTVAGGLSLAAAHVRNFRLTRIHHRHTHRSLRAHRAAADS